MKGFEQEHCLLRSFFLKEPLWLWTLRWVGQVQEHMAEDQRGACWGSGRGKAEDEVLELEWCGEKWAIFTEQNWYGWNLSGETVEGIKETLIFLMFKLDNDAYLEAERLGKPHLDCIL